MRTFDDPGMYRACLAAEGGHELGTLATLPEPTRCVSVGVEPIAKGSRT